MRDYYTRYPRPILWLIPGGRVTVGGHEADARPSFTVEVASFYLAKTPVSNEEYAAFDPGFERTELSSGDRDAALGLSWEQAQAYCRWYAQVARKAIRLPTEVEWEHACRGGAAGRWFWGDDPAGAELFCWHRDNSGRALPPLAEKKANEHGLYGMLGGAWEWTSSPYRPYPLDPDAGGAPSPLPEEKRVLRGGSFRTPLSEISCSRRRAEGPGVAVADAGFRIARSLHAESG
jgi:formylglycine-generating enzyme required for sulfatase activity